MTAPTVELRLKRKYIVLSVNQTLIEGFRAQTPENWQMVCITDLDDIGDWHEILLYRFILLDLDEADAFDPLDVIRILRRQYQINTAVFCFGGDEDIQDEMRLSRADRFFTPQEMQTMLPRFFEQYAWGE